MNPLTHHASRITLALCLCASVVSGEILPIPNRQHSVKAQAAKWTPTPPVPTAANWTAYSQYWFNMQEILDPSNSLGAIIARQQVKPIPPPPVAITYLTNTGGPAIPIMPRRDIAWYFVAAASGDIGLTYGPYSAEVSITNLPATNWFGLTWTPSLLDPTNTDYGILWGRRSGHYSYTNWFGATNSAAFGIAPRPAPVINLSGGGWQETNVPPGLYRLMADDTAAYPVFVQQSADAAGPWADWQTEYQATNLNLQLSRIQ